MVNGRVFYAVDSPETLYDHVIAETSFLREPLATMGREKTIAVAPMFNGNPEFFSYLDQLALVARLGKVIWKLLSSIQ